MAEMYDRVPKTVLLLYISAISKLDNDEAQRPIHYYADRMGNAETLPPQGGCCFPQPFLHVCPIKF